MGPLRRQLLEMIQRDDRYDLPASYLDPLRLEAARELFAERREQISVLRRRAEDTGVTEIRSFEDLVPLLFSHTVYKSYPQNLVDQGKWAALGRWLKTLSVEDPTTVDVSDVTNVDAVDRPHARRRPPAARDQRLERQVLVPEFDAWRSRDEEASLGEDARLAEPHAEAAIAPCSSWAPAAGPTAPSRRRRSAGSSGAGPDRSTS